MTLKELRYWDSSVFLAWLLPEPERKKECESVLRAASRSSIQIVTSSVALIEVIRLKGHPELKREYEKKIVSFFRNPYISVSSLTRPIAERARALIWDDRLKWKDATHVATAIYHSIPVLHTYDDQMLGLDKKLLLANGARLRIVTPGVPQKELDFDMDGAIGDEETTEVTESDSEPQPS